MKEKKKILDSNIFKGSLSFFILTTILLFQALPFDLLNIDINSIKKPVLYTYSVLVQIIGIILVFIIYKDYIIKSFNEAKKKKNIYLKKYLKFWFLILVLTAVLNFIIMMFNGGNIANNEELVRSSLNSAPIYMWISAVLVAPFFEELMFRLSIKSVFKTKWLFIIISGLLFGLAHVASSVTNVFDLLYIIPYSVPGLIFAYVLSDSDNIFTTIGMHMLHNGVAMALQIFLMIFGAM